MPIGQAFLARLDREGAQIPVRERAKCRFADADNRYRPHI